VSHEHESTEARVLGILREHARPLERLASSYARSQADRQDLLQDIALAMLSALPRFRGECSDRTFLLRVAHNRALTFVARRGAPTADIDDHPESVVATGSKNPAIAYERRERESRLLAAVRALPVPHRQVLTLSLEGLSHKEIAEVLGTTENAVAVRANRARAALRVLMDATDGENEGEAR